MESSWTLQPEVREAGGVFLPLYFDDAALREKHKAYGDARFYVGVDEHGREISTHYVIEEGTPYSKAMGRIKKVAASSPQYASMFDQAVYALMDGTFDQSPHSKYL